MNNNIIFVTFRLNFRCSFSFVNAYILLTTTPYSSEHLKLLLRVFFGVMTARKKWISPSKRETKIIHVFTLRSIRRKLHKENVQRAKNCFARPAMVQIIHSGWGHVINTTNNCRYTKNISRNRHGTEKMKIIQIQRRSRRNKCMFDTRILAPKTGNACAITERRRFATIFPNGRGGRARLLKTKNALPGNGLRSLPANGLICLRIKTRSGNADSFANAVVRTRCVNFLRRAIRK